MPNLKETRNRITSIMSTQQITKAMKLVSATKLRRAQTGIVQMRPYAAKLKNILTNLSGSIEDPSLAKYFDVRDPKNVLIVVITSDRGLCGAFNANVIKRVRQMLQTTYAGYSKEQITMLCVGKKGFDFFTKAGYQVIADYRTLFQSLNAGNSFEFAQHLLNLFTTGEYDKIEIVYNQFKNAATQIITTEQLLPVDMNDFKVEGNVSKEYIFEPSKVEILAELVPRTLKTQVYKALLDSFASEHGARMVAMEKATENAGELLKSLRLAYNQARQAAITKELSEIVGGVAAMNG